MSFASLCFLLSVSDAFVFLFDFAVLVCVCRAQTLVRVSSSCSGA